MTEVFRDFHFVCPEDRVEEAKQLISKIPTVSISPGEIKTFALNIGADVEINPRFGITIEGVIAENKIQELVGVLSEADIAGYSRETMILTSTDGEVMHFGSHKWGGGLPRPKSDN